MNKIEQIKCQCGHPKYTHNVFTGECEVRTCKCTLYSQEPQSVSTPTEGMELNDEEIKAVKFPCDDKKCPYGNYSVDMRNSQCYYCVAKLNCKAQVAKVLSNLPTEQDTRIKNLEIQLKNWQEFYVADVNHQRRSNMQKVICPNPCIDFPQCKDRIPHLPDNDWCQRPCDIVEGVGKCIPIPESDEDIRKSERMKIGSWLENETRGVNFGAWAYWWNSVIDKLKQGQKVYK